MGCSGMETSSESSERHNGVVDRALGIGSRPGHVICVEAIAAHHGTAVGNLLTRSCLDRDCPSFTFTLTLLSID